MSEVHLVTWGFGGRQLGIKSALALASLRFPKRELVTAVAVMTAESQRWTKAWHLNHEHIPGTTENAVSNETGGPVVLSGDYGLMQINVPGPDGPIDNTLFEPKKNMKRAALMFEARGWQPWAAYNSGRYQIYVPEIQKKYDAGTWRALVPVWKAR